MHIHLMRHGQCLSQELNRHQPLSPVGREQTMKTARAARALGLRFQLIAPSSTARALHTAEIMAEATGYPLSRIAVTDALNPMAQADDTLDFINGYEGLDSILVTGHLPSLAVTAAQLLGVKGLELSFDNSCLMQIVVPKTGDRGILNWHLTPMQLGLIAGS
ncbi:MAG: histidine phosphatase family protein [Proteobacteria bacterium]|nr:histidine phosphatase family protein [Pseudomonadota bacterium]